MPCQDPSLSELAKPFRMALPSFAQQLTVLKDSGLVRSRKHGLVRTYELRMRRSRTAELWLARQRAMWAKRLDRLDNYLVRLKEADK